MKDVIFLSLTEQSRMLCEREISSEELTRAYIERTAAADSVLGAFITLDGERALLRAAESDARRARGESLGTLDGIVYAAKDNIVTRDLRTTCASRMLESFVPMYDATVIKKLNERGAILLGKTNMDEFAMGSTGERSAFFPCKNPLDQSRVTGGSSSGSAAAVAAGEVSFALGSDTGGSVRLPSAYCGAVGFKPTYSSVSRYGLIPFASSLDVIGPICRTVHDCAEVQKVIRGRDARDATSADIPFAEVADGGCDMKGMRVAFLCDTDRFTVDDEVRAGALHAAEIIREMGGEVCEVNISSLDSSLSAYYIISSAEASSNLARFDGVRYGYRTEHPTESIEELFSRSRAQGFGEEVKRRILLGTFVLSEGYSDKYYKKATAVARTLCRELDELFCEYDLILSPVAPCGASTLGESRGRAPTNEYEKDIFTVFANLCGLPAISLPTMADERGMPIGIQLVAARGRDDMLLRCAAAFELARGEVEVRRDI